MTLTIGYHASHEQFAPNDLLDAVKQAEAAGWMAAMCSDHFLPWSAAQGQSGFAWSWLGAALEATSLAFGVVNAPGWRYHPAIIAQAAATLEVMYPGRFWIAVGSGEAINEHITGLPWPSKPERNAQLKECVDVIRALWAGEMVYHHGRVVVDAAQLYTRPATPPRLVGAAITPETAAWMAPWVDGLITVNQPGDKLQRVVDAFRGNGGADKPMLLQVKIAYGQDETAVLQDAMEQWRTNIFSSDVLGTLTLPEQFEAIGKFVTPAALQEYVHVSCDLDQHVAWLQSYVELGFEELYLHNVCTDQSTCIKAFAEYVIPALTQK